MVAEIETDKASMEMDSQEEGFLAKILVQGGTNDVDVGTPIAILAEMEEDVAKFKEYRAEGMAVTSASTPASEATTSAEGGSATKADRIGPAVQRLVRQMNVDVSSVAGTGPFGVITKGDLLGVDKNSLPAKTSPAAVKPAQETSSAATMESSGIPEDEYEDIPHTTVRKIIAKGLLDSKNNFPHQYAAIDVNLDSLLGFRKKLKAMGVAASVNDLIIKAAAMSLREVPQMNSYWDETAGAVVQNDSVDIAVAVATDGGLITPLVRNADSKKVSAINAEVKDLATRARSNKLKPEEFQGGSFTISNLGMFGISEFTAIINPYGTQGSILAIGGGKEKVQLVSSKPVSSTVMTASLSVDGRAYGGETVGVFLKSFRAKLQNPGSLFM